MCNLCVCIARKLKDLSTYLRLSVGHLNGSAGWRKPSDLSLGLTTGDLMRTPCAKPYISMGWLRNSDGWSSRGRLKPQPPPERLTTPRRPHASSADSPTSRRWILVLPPTGYHVLMSTYNLCEKKKQKSKKYFHRI